MKSAPLRRGAAALALGVVAAGGVVAVAASPASAVVTGAVVEATADIDDDGSCSAPATPAGSPASVPFSDNSVPVSNAASASGQIVNPGNSADVVSASSSAGGTVRATPLGGSGAAQIVVDANASASVGTQIAGSACDPGSSSSSRVRGSFTIPAPMWVTLTVVGDGNGSTFASINNGADGLSLTGGAFLARVNGSSTTLLPAGTIDFSATTFAIASATGVFPRSQTTTSRVVFDLKPVGFGAPVTGKTNGQVALGERNCAAGVVPVNVTPKKASKKARTVIVRLNGAKVATLRGRKVKARTLNVAVASASPATVTTTVIVKRKGKTTRYTASRSYLACS